MSIFNSNLENEAIISVLKDVKARIYFVGILGSGMYPLAQLLHSRGYLVSGSDRKVQGDGYVDRNGIRIYGAGNMPFADMLVYSLAIDEGDPEILSARSSGVPLVSRAQLLGALMSLAHTGISVSGSHGKSTTTAIIEHIFDLAKLKYTAVSGAELACGASYVDKGDDILLAEACEYKDSFLRLLPTYQIITSVELDHTDYFPTVDDLYASFLTAARRARYTLINADDPLASRIADRLREDSNRSSRSVITYGTCESADYRFHSVRKDDDATHFTLTHVSGDFKLSSSLIGRYNLYNICAAVSLAHSVGVEKSVIERAVRGFKTIDRRMSPIASIRGRTVYYDYAHHPSEIGAVIDALMERYKSICVVFRPHTYSRTKSLWNDFIKVLCKADFTILLDIYPAREEPVEGITSQALAQMIPCATYASMLDAPRIAINTASDVILLLGAGEVEQIKQDFIDIGKRE